MAETTLTVARFVNVVSTVFRGFFQKFVAPYHVLNWLEGGGGSVCSMYMYVFLLVGYSVLTCFLVLSPPMMRFSVPRVFLLISYVRTASDTNVCMSIIFPSPNQKL